jgi:NADH:ubiquinone oxidoreductase subunit H
MLRSSWSFLVSLVVAFLIFNVLVVGAALLVAAIDLDWVIGLFWFLVKAISLSAFFVLMRGTLPRVRIDQLMGFAWKWLIPAALANIFVTAAAILVIEANKGTPL